MEQTLALAALGEGTTSPNPRVGCLLVRDGQPVGRGFHRAAGDAHAEAGAVAEAGERACGATVYVNLEPCSHRGRTPPCADLLVRARVRRVVASITDPNPEVDGRGFARLRQAGIEVEVGPLEREARRLNAPFLHVHTAGRPLVTLKAAASADGMIAAGGGASRWITGASARIFAHRIRLRHDAVLVGSGTVRRDDPLLTVRLHGVRADRVRVVLAPDLDIDPAARMLHEGGGRVRIYTAPNPSPRRVALLEGRADVVAVPAPGGRLDLAAVLRDLGGLGVLSVLVEGGARTFAGFLEAGLADRVDLFTAPILLGARGGTPLLDLEAPASPDAAVRIEVEHRIPLGEDVLLVGAIHRAQA
ncbi:MAG: bifunctional diaminohydroxyphosphoribosylaminopyrimidine deaminase/5-amino-6-(5-phosphoribosylamino)uracil reductase RibD [Acidobacteriia bacterium]|nr:bifunctional diaminohydroxyphosphoribosylaminopyrimidine deaminase/5-amino-6-(5-phosphoribosylamino)uracil reductase RibD [Terriglobia bacterium]